MPSTSPAAPNYTWDERTGRYRGANTGRFVSSSEIRAACLDTAKAAGENVKRLTGELRQGDLTLAEWQTAMMREIKTVHVAEAAAARGGWAQMSQSDWGYTGSLIRKEYAYLDNLAIEIETGKQPLNGRLAVRAEQYAKAGASTYDQVRARYEQNSNQMEEETLVLGLAEHCDECLADAAKGYVPIGTLKPIGARVCRRNCKCFKRYRRATPEGYVYAE